MSSCKQSLLESNTTTIQFINTKNCTRSLYIYCSEEEQTILVVKAIYGLKDKTSCKHTSDIYSPKIAYACDERTTTTNMISQQYSKHILL